MSDEDDSESSFIIHSPPIPTENNTTVADYESKQIDPNKYEPPDLPPDTGSGIIKYKLLIRVNWGYFVTNCSKSSAIATFLWNQNIKKSNNTNSRPMSFYIF